MSRYVELELGAIERGELIAGLRELGLELEQAQHPGEQVMLEGSLECPGQPVDLRLAAGVEDSVEDFGFVEDEAGGRWRLVCGEYDRRRLESGLLDRLRRVLALRRVRHVAAEMGAQVDERVEGDGARRIRLTKG